MSMVRANPVIKLVVICSSGSEYDTANKPNQQVTRMCNNTTKLIPTSVRILPFLPFQISLEAHKRVITKPIGGITHR